MNPVKQKQKKENKMMRSKVLAVLVILCCAVAAVSMATDELTAIARDIQKKNQDAVVWVEGVLNLQFSGMQGQSQNQEQKVETLGTIINESGLTVVPNSTLNPVSMMSSMMKSQGMSVDGQLSDVKIRLADGTELAAEVVMKDEDLDLAFLLPTAEEGKKLPEFTYVNLNDTTEVKTLDQIITLGRMPKLMNRQESVNVCRISCVIEKPRKFYCVDVIGGMGVPAFATNSRLVGVIVLKKSVNIDMSSVQNGGITPVILPAEDVRDIADQALVAIKKASEEKADKKNGEKPEDKKADVKTDN